VHGQVHLGQVGHHAVVGLDDVDDGLHQRGRRWRAWGHGFGKS
jgi:hypothetical protein